MNLILELPALDYLLIFFLFFIFAMIFTVYKSLEPLEAEDCRVNGTVDADIWSEIRVKPRLEQIRRDCAL